MPKERRYEDGHLAKALRRLRRDKLMSQAQLSRTTGVHQSTISHIETGKTTASYETLAQLAKGLGVHGGAFFPK